MISIQQYKPHSDVTINMLKENNFKCIDGCYSCRFPVYKQNKEPMLWCILYIDIENDSCNIQVVDHNNNTYAPFFNRTYGGVNKVIESADNKINVQLEMFVKNKLLKKKVKKK